MQTVKELEQKTSQDESKAIIPRELPLLPLRDTIVYPDQVIPLVIGREKSLRLTDDCMEGDRTIGVVAQKDPAVNDPTPDDLYSHGTAVSVWKVFKMPDGSVRAIVHGLSRIKIIRFTQTEPYFKAIVEPLEEKKISGVDIDALVTNLQSLFQKVVELAPYLTAEVGFLIANTSEAGRLADLIAANLNIAQNEKQEVLETLAIKQRLEKVTYLVNRELQILELGRKIQSQVQGEIGKMQREYYLREQLKAIQRELGEGDEKTVEIEELRKKIQEAKMPPEVEKVARKELDRLSRMQPGAAEHTVSRTYLDWLVELPWSISTEDNLDIAMAVEVLDNDHYDLERVKKRILEYLAVRKLKSDMRGPILCFVGPPGVGKTSLGMSIAKALGRKFVRISLGGIRDEAEIRGHRRTYVGALPGRIIQGIRRAGSNNPVFMLDEIDKIGIDFRGDPSSALLEVLDPEQNHSFSDHYLEVPWNLSSVMFICTANILDTIPPALRDRLEVIEIPGYTEEEKLWIAKKFLVPKQLREHGLSGEQLVFEDEAIRSVIRQYTREAGVRNLEREIATICRAVAKRVVEGSAEKITIVPDNLSEFLGPAKFFSEVAERTYETGVATGVAWTPAGGDIIFVEATKMRGSGKLHLTGQLGEIMKESAQAALSYVKSKAKDFGINESIFDKIDIHIHVPAGAVPKDGPSAGITMCVALVSLLSGRRVRSDVAMTGEITLRGMVLPVGGIKEKVLAARRAGIKEIILPRRNEKDLVEIPEEHRRELVFHLKDKIDEVIEVSLEQKTTAKSREKAEAA